MDIGGKIKELRLMKNLTQEELADRAELSKGFISQLERNLTSPSIATLTDILTCLGTDLKEFFSDSEDTQIVFRKTDYFEKIDEERGNEIQWVVPNAQKNTMEPILVTIEKGGRTEALDPHEGEEFGYLLSGSADLHIGSKAYKVRAGESFYFAAKYRHYLTSSTGAKFLWISTPPSF